MKSSDVHTHNERLILALQNGYQIAFDWLVSEDNLTFICDVPETFSNVPLADVASTREFIKLIHQDDLPLYLQRVRRMLKETAVGKDTITYAEMRLKDEVLGWLWVELFGRVVERDSDGRAVRSVGVFTNIMTRKLAEQNALRLRDLYAALSQTNQAILHIQSKQALFDEICRIAVEHGRFLTSVIRILDPATKLLVKVAGQGKGMDLIESTEVSVDPNKEIGRGPSGIAMRESRSSICDDVSAMPLPQAWRDISNALGMQSFGSFPFRQGDHVVGALILFSAEKNYFDQALIALLEEMMQEISFALDNFDREEERKLAEELQLAQNHILNMVTTGRSLSDILTTLNQFIESQSGRAICSIQLLNSAGTMLYPAVASNLPKTYVKVIARSPLGPGNASFGAAVFGRAPVIVDDIAASPLWLSWRDVALENGLLACSSWPIFGKNNKILGTLSMYYNERTLPSARELQLIDISANLAGIAIENKESEDKIRFLAHYDEMTSLPNRTMFNQILNHAMVVAKRHDKKLAVLFVDLDRFKNINDEFGHEAGDQTLQEIALRMRSSLRKADTVARMGGDEFYILLEELIDMDYASSVAQKILNEASRPFFINKQECQLSASIGIAIYPDDGEDALSLLKNSDIAMYRAKSDGKNAYQFYSASKNIHTVGRLALESQLRRSIENQEFVLHYQPKVELASGRIIGVEALVRWQHPDLGLLAPNHFIPLAEETRLIIPLSKQIMRIACRDARIINATGRLPVRVAVNLSARQLDDSEFLNDIRDLLAGTELTSDLLHLEITESMMMHNPEHAVRIMNELQEMGIRIDVDDFGTGHSSLAYLKRFPVQSLKIDRSFIQDIPTDANDTAITQAIIAMGHSMGMRVIAEGVETAEQMEALRQFGCDEYQGYYFSHPIPLDAFLRLLESHGTGNVEQPKSI